MNKLFSPTRRRFLLNAGILAVGWDLSCTDGALTQELAPTPFCHDGDEPTVSETEGPFFKPRSPERSDLREPGAGGRRFVLSGVVLSRSCRPLRGAVVDLWHADENGEYDNVGFRYRGHVIRRRFPLWHHRTGTLLGPHAALPRQGSSASQPSTDHATVFSQGAGESP